MNEWPEVSLFDLGEVVTGTTPPARSPEFFGTDFPFITPTDLDGRRILLSTERGISQAGAVAMARRCVPVGSVTVSCIGWQLGKVAMIGRDSFTNQQMNTIVPNAQVDAHFLYYELCTRRDEIKLLASGGTRTPILNKTRFQELRLAIPPIPVQRSIASVLSSIDDLIENNRRRVELLERMAQAIYREWFVHFRYPGHENDKLIESPLGPIPEGWSVEPFSEIAQFVNGFAFKPAHWGNLGRPIIKIKELKQGVSSDTPRCAESEIDTRFWIEAGDLLFSWSAFLGAYRWGNEPGLLNQHLFKVVPARDLPVAWLFRCLDAAMPQFWDRAQGTTMRHIKRAALSEVTTMVPAAPSCNRFAEIAEPMDQAVVSLTAANARLVKIRDLLLPRLVTGRVDVSGLDLDVALESVG